MKFVVAALSFVVVAAGCARKETIHTPAQEVTVQTALVERQTRADRIEIDGSVVGRVEAVLSSRLTAPVVEVRAVPGQAVAAGSVLVRLEERETVSALASAEAARDAARAALALAKKNRERFEKLESREAAAVIELERARQEEASATAAALGAEAAVRRAETDRAQAVLIAPFDAVVVERMVSVGDLAEPGRPLVRLASRTGRRVEAAPGEEDAARLSPGAAAEVALEGRVVTGRVAEVVGAVDPQTRRRIVRVELPPDVEPPVGSFARLRLPGPSAEKLFAPARAVVSRGGLDLIWAVSSDGRVALRYVRTGAAAADGKVEIRSGLEGGERVVLDPPADLEEGTRVRS
ncbi:MAG TPA: efflux RND transporter periplasmic adaptor subunit [Thermoanaerobaculia bacterium]